MLHKNATQLGLGGQKSDTKLHIVIIRDIQFFGSIGGLGCALLCDVCGVFCASIHYFTVFIEFYCVIAGSKIMNTVFLLHFA